MNEEVKPQEENKPPGSLLYCRVVNWINIVGFVLVGLVAIAIMIPVFLLKDTSGNMPPRGIMVLIVFLFSMLGFIPAWRLLKLNGQLKNRDPKARTWQSFWSFLFMFSFPIGTVLHGIALSYMLFGTRTRKALTDDAGNSGSSLMGIFTAMPLIILSVGLALWSASMLNQFGNIQNQSSPAVNLQSILSSVQRESAVREQMSAPAVRTAPKPVELRGSTQLVLTNGNTVAGELVEQTEESVTLRIENAGDFTFSRSEIRTVSSGAAGEGPAE